MKMKMNKNQKIAARKFADLFGFNFRINDL